MPVGTNLIYLRNPGNDKEIIHSTLAEQKLNGIEYMKEKRNIKKTINNLRGNCLMQS